MAWYYGTYKEPIMSVGESGEKLRNYYLNNGCFHGLTAMISMMKQATLFM